MKGKLFGLVHGGFGGFCLSITFLLTAVLAVHSSSFADHRCRDSVRGGLHLPKLPL